MTPAGRAVWRASRRSLVLIGVFAAAGAAVVAGAVVTVVNGERWPVSVVLAVIGAAAVVYAWRYGLHPRLVADEDLTVRNPWRTVRIPWSDVRSVRPGENGLVVERGDGPAVEAWCVQTSNRSRRDQRTTRADAVVTALEERARVATATAAPLTRRPATPDEATVLTDLERAANLVALAHVFPVDTHPYPTDDVRRRWERLLADEDVDVVLALRGETPVGFVAYDENRVRHLAVLPEHAGTGVGSTLLEDACDDLFDDPFTREIRLWVLVENRRARAFYLARGWTEAATRRASEFPPYPEELELVRPNPRAARRGR